MAKLVAPGDALCKPLLPEVYEPVLTNIGNGRLVLRDSSGKMTCAAAAEGES